MMSGMQVNFLIGQVYNEKAIPLEWPFINYEKLLILISWVLNQLIIG